MLRSILHRMTTGLVGRLPAGAFRLAAAELGWVLVGAFLFVAVLQFPLGVAGDDTDPSWAQVLAHLQTGGAQAGVDYLFPHGPLHTLSTGIYEPGTFWFDYVAEVLFKLALTGLLVRLARQLSAPAGVLFAVTGGLLNLALPALEPLITLAALAAAWVPVLKGRLTWIDALLGPTFLAAAGLAKFTLVGLGVLDLGVLTVFLLTRRPRWHAAIPLAVYAAATVALAAVAGQKVENLPAYFAAGSAYSAGYVDGMGISGPPIDLQLFGVAVALTAAVAATAGRSWLRRADVIAGLVLLAGTTALGWRIGFVRHDGHALHPFVAGLFLPGFVARAVADAPRPDLRRRLAVAAVVVAVIGCYEVSARPGGFVTTLPASLFEKWLYRAADLIDPSTARDRAEGQAAARRAQFDLPSVREKVGAEPVDVLTESQGVALLNGLTLAPRPTIQSVNAVDADMLRRNAEHFASPTGPRFVLLRWSVFDGRHPTLTDGPALLAVLSRYRPVLDEKGFLLLERRPDPTPPEPRVALDRVASFKEEVAVPAADGGYQSLTLGLEYTLLGRLRLATYRPPVIWLNVKDEAGTWRPYRVIPGIASSEFLIDPLCEGNAELRDLFDGKPGRRVTALMLWIDKPDRPFLRSTFGVTIRAYPAVSRSIGGR